MCVSEETVIPLSMKDVGNYITGNKLNCSGYRIQQNK
jgi:hypothetical protein